MHGLTRAFNNALNFDDGTLLTETRSDYDTDENTAEEGAEDQNGVNMSSGSSPAPESWISAFCSLVGHEYFAEVSEDFIEDDFNLTGLQSQVPKYKDALEMILDVEPEDATEEDEEDEEEEDEDDFDDEMQDGPESGGRGNRRAGGAEERRHLRMASDLSVIESSAEMLYGLIHQRFITSRQGIQQMAEKYESGHFGQCPRVYCHGAKVLPVGCSDVPGRETVKLFCPSCLDVYSPPNSRFQTVDGAFFGTTFGCLFFMTFPEVEVGGQRLRQPQQQLSAHQPDEWSPSANAGASPSNTRDRASRTSAASSLTSGPAQPQTSPSNVKLSPQPETINGVATRNLAPGLGPGNIYEPRIYGFRVAEIAKTGPRMKWLRSRPADINELDECRIWEQSQEAFISQEDMGDSEMMDGELQAEEAEGEVGDEDMDGAPEDGEGQDAEQGRENHEAESTNGRVSEIVKRKKSSRRKKHEGLLNGNASAATVSVGDGG